MNAAAHVAAELVHERLTPAAWRPRVADLLGDGWAFAGLHGGQLVEGGAWLRLALARAGRLALLDCRAAQLRFPSLVELTPAAQWEEREAHDLHGIGFDGHEPLRPLIAHPDELAAWTVPASGEDVHQVAVGPIHAGVIESGHFRLHVVGERVLHLDVRLGYKHRGLEEAATGRPAPEALAYVQRACGACAVTNAVAFAQACEVALGRWPQPELRRARTLLAELERLYNHLGDLSAACAGVGFAAGAAAFAALKERAHRLNARLTGHRFLFGTVALGRSELTLDAGAARAAATEVAALAGESELLWRQLAFSHSVQERFAGVGAVTRADAERLGAVGPAARASGLDDDARCAAPRLAYGGFQAARPTAPSGDVAARVELRAVELRATCALLAELLAAPLEPAGSSRSGCAGGVGASRLESPRGATTCVVELAGDRVAAVHLRTGSYANWPLLAHAAPGNLLPDFPLINKSFELCYACADR